MTCVCSCNACRDCSVAATPDGSAVFDLDAWRVEFGYSHALSESAEIDLADTLEATIAKARAETIEEIIQRARDEIAECDAQNTSLHTARQAFERVVSYWDRRLASAPHEDKP